MWCAFVFFWPFIELEIYVHVQFFDILPAFDAIYKIYLILISEQKKKADLNK